MNVGPGDGRWIPQVFQSGTAPFAGCSGLKEVASLWDNDTWQDTKQCCWGLKIFGVVQQERKVGDDLHTYQAVGQTDPGCFDAHAQVRVSVFHKVEGLKPQLFLLRRS
jgi:hypothetical protein